MQPSPRWEIVSGNATVNLHDYALLRNAVVRVKDVPVFYLPVMYYPIQDDDRATGFLLPTYGRSTYRGHVDQQRVLLGDQPQPGRHASCTTGSPSRGQGGGGEYRYIISPQSQGDFRAYALKEHASDSGDPQRSPSAPAIS